ncbi:GW dipeptide domain-containing protein [Lacticaseibacillus manihotivorans]|nr:GW dipeptide domain-containing protein [Lacticaseibacillus manihotivorans]QFQ92431.1 hypothetical protein LM010_13850 [Lacticaseibacillus manihotivorans]
MERWNQSKHPRVGRRVFLSILVMMGTLFVQGHADQVEASDNHYASIISRSSVQETVKITQQGRNDGLFINAPYRTTAATMSTTTMAKEYDGQFVNVIAHARTADGDWIEFKLNQLNYWMDARGAKVFKFNPISEKITQHANAQIIQTNRHDGLFTDGPYHTSLTTLSTNLMAARYDNQGVQLLATAKAGGIKWAQIKLSDGHIYWIDARGLRVLVLKTTSAIRQVNQPARVDQSSRNDGLFSAGPYLSSLKSLHADAMARSLNGRGVTIRQEATVDDLHWAQIELSDHRLFWIDARGIKALRLGTIRNQQPLRNQAGRITQSKRNDGLFTDGPFWTSLTTLGANAMAKQYAGQGVLVLASATSGNTQWLQVQMNDGKRYWIDAKGVNRLTLKPITSHQTVAQDARLSGAKQNDGLFASGPYLSNVNALAASGLAKQYEGQGGRMSETATSGGIKWVHITFSNRKAYWVDARLTQVVTITPVTERQTVNRNALVTENGRHDGLFIDGPYKSSYTTLTSAGNLRQFDHQVVHVRQVATAGGISWSQIKVTDGKQYWVDSRALTTTNYDMVLTKADISSGAQIVQNGRHDGLFASGPYHTSPATATTTKFANQYNGQYVTVIAQATTRLGKWVQIQMGNGNSYWLDAAGVKLLTTPISRVINVPNYNQFKAGAPVGCEGVSLYQALRAKGYAGKYSLRAFLNTIPKANTPFSGFVGSPFVANNNTYTAIFAAPLAKWGSRFGKVSNVSGRSVNQLMQLVLSGDSVVAYVTEHFAPVRWGNWSFGRVPNNNHAVTIAGADLANQKLYLSDPIDGKYWISVQKFSRIYDARNKMAVVVQ